MAEGKGEGQVAIVEYRQENGEEVPTLMLIKEGNELDLDFSFIYFFSFNHREMLNDRNSVEEERLI
jgi:hypothetical protein